MKQVLLTLALSSIIAPAFANADRWAPKFAAQTTPCLREQLFVKLCHDLAEGSALSEEENRALSKLARQVLVDLQQERTDKKARSAQELGSSLPWLAVKLLRQEASKPPAAQNPYDSVSNVVVPNAIYAGRSANFVERTDLHGLHAS